MTGKLMDILAVFVESILTCTQSLNPYMFGDEDIH